VNALCNHYLLRMESAHQHIRSNCEAILPPPLRRHCSCPHRGLACITVPMCPDLCTAGVLPRSTAAGIALPCSQH
jgi:hypothetical protein